MATAMSAPNEADHTVPFIGFTKEKAPGISIEGFLIIRLIPSSIYGMEKSTTVSREAVMVTGATAMSASYRILHHEQIQNTMN